MISGELWDHFHLATFKRSKRSSGPSTAGSDKWETDESGNYYMGRTSPISSIGDYDPEYRDDDPNGWVGSSNRNVTCSCIFEINLTCIALVT